MEKSIGVTLSSGGGIGRSTRKVRCRPKEPLDPDDPIVDAKGMMVNSSGSTNESWKDKLMGNSADDKFVVTKQGKKLIRRWKKINHQSRRRCCKKREIKDVGKEWQHGGEANKRKGKGKGNPKGKGKGPAL
ncbi:hypothetical protein Gohar_001153, partial [Gossypium harknessii]|nr:hypothetical protein [Gossypium harknessii]